MQGYGNPPGRSNANVVSSAWDRFSPLLRPPLRGFTSCRGCVMDTAAKRWGRSLRSGADEGIIRAGKEMGRPLPDRVLPVVPRVGAEFVQDHLLQLPIRLATTRLDGSEILPSRSVAHRNPPPDSWNRVTPPTARRVTFLNVSTPRHRQHFNTSRYDVLLFLGGRFMMA